MDASATDRPRGAGPLEGEWTVHRVGGLLPPMIGVRKRIAGARGRTTAGPLGLPFDVIGSELHYRVPLLRIVDELTRTGEDSIEGKVRVSGLAVGRFRMTRKTAPAAGQGEGTRTRETEEAGMTHHAERDRGASRHERDDEAAGRLEERAQRQEAEQQHGDTFAVDSDEPTDTSGVPRNAANRVEALPGDDEEESG